MPFVVSTCFIPMKSKIIAFLIYQSTTGCHDSILAIRFSRLDVSTSPIELLNKSVVINNRVLQLNTDNVISDHGSPIAIDRNCFEMVNRL